MRLPIGLLRSLIIYYCQPWRRIALKRLYAEFLEDDALVFDIGAHVGNHTRTFLALGCRVVALEPQPDFADFLEKTLRGPRVFLVREAAGARVGQTELRISSRHPTVSTISESWIDAVKWSPGFRHVRWDEVVSVPMTTLDALISVHGCPKFCKIDVEGAEADILNGLSHPIDILSFEYIPAAIEVAEACLERIRQLGSYRFNRIVGEQQRFKHAEWLEADAMLRILRGMDESERSGNLYARLNR
ncbi:FkbM family methyltransferase [Limoniibacter endophyticus]|uniref:Methyltransferase FkbM domain-containing protein n=1 Tax=Limoniibacter endophyticus TaxID=1565040 RepID=A0A8J3GH21_9HYPH|nr:FkbM family methyltransferase [Limoniibacter endophyticus]GHC69135.1 hypothetical protein GCM10010136_14570 [Limoniibacter endophyticus]